MKTMNRRLLTFAAALAATLALNTDAFAQTTGTTGTTAKGAAEEMAKPMTDADIASIVTTANQGEMKAADLAKKKAQNKEVKNFANHMVAEHTKNANEGKALMSKMKIEPAPNAASETLKKKSEAMQAELASLSGSAFDKQYMSDQIAMHQQLLTSLDKNLIPNAKSPEMKSYLEKTRTHVQQHLNQAEKIQTALNK